MSKVIVVTGGSEGIGYHVVRLLAQKSSKNHVVFTSRSKKKGLEREKKLKSLGIKNVEFQPLELSSSESIKTFVETFVKNHKKCDVLINNAGVSHMTTVDKPSFRETTTLKTAKKNIEVNFVGTVNFTNSMLPIMKKPGKIIVVTSMGGIMCTRNMDKELLKKYITSKSYSELKSLVDEFLSFVKEGIHIKKGYDSKYSYLSYGVSKLALNEWVRILGEKFKDPEKEMYITAMHPGHCATRMTSLSPYQKITAEDGAKNVIWLVEEAEVKKFHGKFSSSKTVVSYSL